MTVQDKVKELQREGKKVLTLILKQKYFDQILSGKKRQEFREIKPSTEKKYIKFGADGYPLEDENYNCIPIHYDYILFYVGYNTDRDSMIVEVKDAHTEVMVDENGEVLFYFIDKRTNKECVPATYDPETGEGFDKDGNLMPNAEQYFVEQITYDLGEVVVADVH